MLCHQTDRSPDHHRMATISSLFVPRSNALRTHALSPFALSCPLIKRHHDSPRDGAHHFIRTSRGCRSFCDSHSWPDDPRSTHCFVSSLSANTDAFARSSSLHPDLCNVTEQNTPSTPHQTPPQPQTHKTQSTSSSTNNDRTLSLSLSRCKLTPTP